MEKVHRNTTGDYIHSDSTYTHLLPQQGGGGGLPIRTLSRDTTRLPHPPVHKGNGSTSCSALQLLDIYIRQQITVGKVVLLHLAEIARQMGPIFVLSMITLSTG